MEQVQEKYLSTSLVHNAKRSMLLSKTMGTILSTVNMSHWNQECMTFTSSFKDGTFPRVHSVWRLFQTTTLRHAMPRGQV